MAYISIKSKIKKIIDNQIIPILLHNRDLDYDKVAEMLINETGGVKSAVEEILDQCLKSNGCITIKTMTISDIKIPSFLEELKEKEKAIKQDLKDAKIDEIVGKKKDE